MAGQASSLQLELGYMREDRPVTACCCLLGWTGQRGNWAGLGTRRCSIQADENQLFKSSVTPCIRYIRIIQLAMILSYK